MEDAEEGLLEQLDRIAETVAAGERLAFSLDLIAKIESEREDFKIFEEFQQKEQSNLIKARETIKERYGLAVTSLTSHFDGLKELYQRAALVQSVHTNSSGDDVIIAVDIYGHLQLVLFSDALEVWWGHTLVTRTSLARLVDLSGRVLLARPVSDAADSTRRFVLCMDTGEVAMLSLDPGDIPNETLPVPIRPETSTAINTDDDVQPPVTPPDEFDPVTTVSARYQLFDVSDPMAGLARVGDVGVVITSTHGKIAVLSLLHNALLLVSHAADISALAETEEMRSVRVPEAEAEAVRTRAGRAGDPIPDVLVTPYPVDSPSPDQFTVYTTGGSVVQFSVPESPTAKGRVRRVFGVPVFTSVNAPTPAPEDDDPTQPAPDYTMWERVAVALSGHSAPGLPLSQTLLESAGSTDAGVEVDPPPTPPDMMSIDVGFMTLPRLTPAEAGRGPNLSQALPTTKPIAAPFIMDAIALPSIVHTPAMSTMSRRPRPYARSRASSEFTTSHMKSTARLKELLDTPMGSRAGDVDSPKITHTHREPVAPPESSLVVAGASLLDFSTPGAAPTALVALAGPDGVRVISAQSRTVHGVVPTLGAGEEQPGVTALDTADGLIVAGRTDGTVAFADHHNGIISIADPGLGGLVLNVTVRGRVAIAVTEMGWFTVALPKVEGKTMEIPEIAEDGPDGE